MLFGPWILYRTHCSSLVKIQQRWYPLNYAKKGKISRKLSSSAMDQRSKKLCCLRMYRLKIVTSNENVAVLFHTL